MERLMKATLLDTLLKGEEQRDTFYANSPALGTTNNTEDLQTPPSANTVPLGGIPVPTGRVLVPAAAIMDPPHLLKVDLQGEHERTLRERYGNRLPE
nr:hypothetical protein [Tanacetum cinerariifolium]